LDTFLTLSIMPLSGRRRQVRLSRRPVTVPLDEPPGVVELDERAHGLGELLGVAPGSRPDALLLQRSDEPLGATDAVASPFLPVASGEFLLPEAQAHFVHDVFSRVLASHSACLTA